jgi:apolipoprotein N-acyltransferase
MNRTAKYLALVGAGALVAASMPPWGFWPLAFVGVAIFARVSASLDNARSRFVGGFLFAIAWFAPGMGWMWHLTAPGYVIAIPLFAALHGVATMVSARARHLMFAAPLAHTLAEALRFSMPFGGVPLATLAISQADSPSVHLAAIGGPILLSWFVFQVGFIAAYQLGLRSVRRSIVTVVTIVLVVVIAPVTGGGSNTGEVLRVAAVQGGGPQGTLAINTRSRDVVDRHLEATRSIDESIEPDLVIWPENVVDVDEFSMSTEREEIAAEAARLNAPFLIGITENVDSQAFTNAQVVVNVDGTLGDRYDKVRRVPFGEFVPLRSALEALGAPVDRIPRDARAGEGPGLLRVGDSVLAVAISWEVFFAGRANEGVELGAAMLVNPTNGSSYTGTILQTQQIASSRLRAVETGRWVVQVSPTGFSAFVSPEGEVFDRTGVSERRVIVREIPLRDGRTIYSFIGDQPILITASATLLSLLVLGKRRRDGNTAR